MTPGWKPLLRRFGLAALLCLLSHFALAAAPDADARAARLRQLLATPQGQETLDLLGTPEVRARLVAPAAQATSPSAATWGEGLDDALADMRTRLTSLGGTGGRLGGGLAEAWDWMRDNVGLGQVESAVFYLPLFLLSGVGLEWLFYVATAEWRRHVGSGALDTMRERALILLQRLVYGLLLVVCFATGSLGAFMMFRWPALLRTVILDYLIALVVTRLCLVALRFLLAPNADRLRLVPLSTRTAWFWYRGLSIAAGVAAFGWQTVSVLQTFAVPDVTLDSLRLLVGLAMVLVGVALAWLAARLPHDGNGGRLARSALPAVATLGLPFLWLVFVAGLGELGWTIGVLAALPVAIYVARHAAATVVRSADATPGHGVALERAAQILVVVVAALAVMRAWHADLWALSIGDTPGPRLVRGVVEAVAIVLLTDLAWRAIRARIDHHLDLSVPDAMLDEAEAHRRSRVRTLLPVLRNALLIVLLALASLSALSAIGLRIGPLLAGAGIAGIALGLGAQTLVRDVISGIFFLLDDAFRVGEYIESGAISGTVEAFSLRSIMLRHYKGQLHTVPFGDLKTVTNYSRTWMAAELEILVTHEVDLEAVEAAIREVSEALSAEPELAGFIIDPLRSLGATAITESAIRFGAIIKVKAGQQFAARRLGYAHVRAVFAVRRIPLAAPRLHIETRPHGVAGSGA